MDVLTSLLIVMILQYLPYYISKIDDAQLRCRKVQNAYCLLSHPCYLSFLHFFIFRKRNCRSVFLFSLQCRMSQLSRRSSGFNFFSQSHKYEKFCSVQKLLICLQHISIDGLWMSCHRMQPRVAWAALPWSRPKIKQRKPNKVAVRSWSRWHCQQTSKPN